jgi:hypothetical protein
MAGAALGKDPLAGSGVLGAAFRRHGDNGEGGKGVTKHQVPPDNGQAI